MPTVYIWYPDEKNHYGHAALQTDKYYISFWPDGDVKQDLGVIKCLDYGVPGCLHFHPELDRFYEGKRKATATYKIVNATDEAINDIHEEFLRYNEIDPEEVTIEKGGELVDDGEEPTKSFSKTKYSFLGDLVRDLGKRKIRSKLEIFRNGGYVPFYHEKQSCVTFCFNIIELADPNPRVCYVEDRPHNSADMPYDNREMDYRVPWFEKDIVQKYWLEGCVNKRVTKCIIL